MFDEDEITKKRRQKTARKLSFFALRRGVRMDDRKLFASNLKVLTVVELRDELKKRHLENKGNKDVLVARLERVRKERKKTKRHQDSCTLSSLFPLPSFCLDCEREEEKRREEVIVVGF